MPPETSSPSGQAPTVLVITPGGRNPWMLINAIAPAFPGLTVLMEKPERKRDLFRRRMRRAGIVNATGQLATMVVSKIGKGFAARRLDEIARTHGLDPNPNPAVRVIGVGSANDEEARATIGAIRPAVVLTVSCRLLSRATLDAIGCPVINVHPAINPAYRGQMGGYWSLVEGDSGNFGLTVHLVDPGVDTGAILYQLRTAPEPGDSMLTYPALLTARAVGITRQAIGDALEDRLRPVPPEGPSHLRFNVTLWAWLYHGLTKGIW